MIELKHVSKVFETAGGRVEALKDISLTIPDGDVYGIIGMSGAGKSTLVRCINMLERPTSGEVIVNGKRLDTMSPAQLRAARRDITMIFQRFNLLMQRNCLDNVCFPMELAGVSRREAASRAQELLETVGLPDKAKAYPAQLSGGQQQRVAIARALATNPKVLLCDEATSALDPKTTRQILELIGDINKKLGITVVIITHQMSVVKSVCNHVAILDDGEVVEDGLVSTVFSAPKSAAGENEVARGGGFRRGRHGVRSRAGAPHPPHLPQRKDHLDPAGGPPRDGGEHRGQRHFRQHAEALGGDLRQYAARRPRGAV